MNGQERYQEKVKMNERYARNKINEYKSGAKALARYQAKLLKSSTYGKVKPLGMTTVFGWYDGEEATGRLITCRLCGAVVQYDNEKMELHRVWHDMLRTQAEQ